MFFIGPGPEELLLAVALAVYGLRSILELSFGVRLGWRGTGVLAVGVLVLPYVMLPAGAAAFCACVIWRFVRWLNRRDDPRFAVPPSDERTS